MELKSGWVEAPSEKKRDINLFDIDFSEEKAFGQWCTDDECEDRQGMILSAYCLTIAYRL